ncbi:MAG: response regulator [Cyclobacteriaceae bacterium]|jgi:CheY-like chemotaxis protein|nr:response regulator [Cyclobacteriaceae bacterium]
MNLNTTTPVNILVAEDDDDDYLIFSIAIKETSFTYLLKRAENGEILLKCLNDELPDILFLDLLMPCMDGKQCLKEIRANKKYDSLPIIVYSSLNDLNSVEYCYREGSNLYVIKPNSINDLKSILERILAIDWKKTMYFPQKSQFVVNA